MARTSEARKSDRSTDSPQSREAVVSRHPFDLSKLPLKTPGLSSAVTPNFENRGGGGAGERLLFALVESLVGGINFIVDTLPAIVYARRECEEMFHQRLVDAQWRRQRGEIDAAEFAQIEQQVSASLRVLRRDY